MTNYIKVRPYVAHRLGVEQERYRYADGNVLLWDKELRMIDPGWVFHPEETAARIGGLMMDPYRNREEQEKTADECTPLPEPTDPDWMMPAETAETEPEANQEAMDPAIDDAMEETETESGSETEEGGEA